MTHLYIVPVGTKIKRLRWDHTGSQWIVFVTTREATYDESDVQTHGTADFSYIFRLPSNMLYVSIAVKKEDLRILERIV